MIMNKWINDIDENNIKVKCYCKQCHKPMVYVDKNNHTIYKNYDDICTFCYDKKYLAFIDDYHISGKDFDIDVSKIRIGIKHALLGYHTRNGYKIVIYFYDNNEKNWYISFLFKFEELIRPTYNQLIEYRDKNKYNVLNDDFIRYLHDCSEKTFNKYNFKMYIGL